MIRIKKAIAAILLCLIVGLLALPMDAYAYSPAIRNITIHIVLNQDGSADITETWDVTVADGTEWYLVQGNLGDIKIQNFSVTDENGTVFENEGDWDVDRSIGQKTGKCGIVNKGHGNYELCWGVGSYGNHIYTVSYHMTNFVKGFDDYCAFNQRVINDQLSSAPQEIHVVVTKPGTPFTTEEVGVWAFGFDGTIYVKNGVVEADSSATLSSNDYVTVMCRFPRDMFDTESIITGSFDEMKDKAFVGSDYSSGITNDTATILSILLPFVGFTVLAGSFVALLIISGTKSNQYTTFEAEREKLAKQMQIKFYQRPAFWIAVVALLCMNPILLLIFIICIVQKSKKKVKISTSLSGNAYPAAYVARELSAYQNYYRDIPLQGSIPCYFAIGCMTKAGATNNNIIGAYLLKWLQEGCIEIRNERKCGISGVLGNEAPSIILKKTTYDSGYKLEHQLYEMLSIASGGDNILQEMEMYRWAKQNYKIVNKLMKNFEESGKAMLKEMGHLGTITSTGAFGILLTTQDAFTDSGREQMFAIKGLKNFLKDFTIMNERPPEDITLWDKYMIAAQMFGMADKVAEKFRHIYPAYFEQHASYYRNHMGAYAIINTISQASTKGVSASSGGGGHSSSGGGGGSSGGGSGGGSR